MVMMGIFYVAVCTVLGGVLLFIFIKEFRVSLGLVICMAIMLIFDLIILIVSILKYFFHIDRINF